MQEIYVQTLGQEDPLEKGMANHSSILALKIPWTEMPDGLQPLGLQRVGHPTEWPTLSLLSREVVVLSNLETLRCPKDYIEKLFSIVKNTSMH